MIYVYVCVHIYTHIQLHTQIYDKIFILTAESLFFRQFICLYLGGYFEGTNAEKRQQKLYVTKLFYKLLNWRHCFYS